MKNLAMIAAAMLVSGSAVAEDQYLTDLFAASDETSPIVHEISVQEVGESSTDQYLVDLFEASDETSPIVWDQRSVSAPEVGDSSTDDYLTDLFNASNEG